MIVTLENNQPAKSSSPHCYGNFSQLLTLLHSSLSYKMPLSHSLLLKKSRFHISHTHTLTLSLFLSLCLTHTHTLKECKTSTKHRFILTYAAPYLSVNLAEIKPEVCVKAVL